MKQLIVNMLPERIYLEIRRRNYIKNNKIEFEMNQKLRKSQNNAGYCLKPFDEKRAIFIHIPKCAGISINQILFNSLAGGHKTLDKYLCIFEPECILSYFKFSIVRNPWDRLVSAYSFLEKGGINNKDKSFFAQELSCFSNFEDFVKKWLNKKNIWKYKHFHPQSHYIVDKRNKIKLDFLGLFENIEEDFEYIKKRVGSEGTLRKTNASQHSLYTNYYTQETIDIVARVYQEDIALFGYNFDNSSLKSQLTARSVK